MDRVVFLEDYTFNGKTYKKGHQFNVVGSDGIRGLDLKDDDGNAIYETRFISHLYKSLSDIRDEKLRKDLGL